MMLVFAAASSSDTMGTSTERQRPKGKAHEQRSNQLRSCISSAMLHKWHFDFNARPGFGKRGLAGTAYRNGFWHEGDGTFAFMMSHLESYGALSPRMA